MEDLEPADELAQATRMPRSLCAFALKLTSYDRGASRALLDRIPNEIPGWSRLPQGVLYKQVQALSGYQPARPATASVKAHVPPQAFENGPEHDEVAIDVDLVEEESAEEQARGRGIRDATEVLARGALEYRATGKLEAIPAACPACLTLRMMPLSESPERNCPTCGGPLVLTFSVGLAAGSEELAYCEAFNGRINEHIRVHVDAQFDANRLELLVDRAPPPADEPTELALSADAAAASVVGDTGESLDALFDAPAATSEAEADAAFDAVSGTAPERVADPDPEPDSDMLFDKITAAPVVESDANLAFEAVKAELDSPRATDPDPEPDSDVLFDKITAAPVVESDANLAFEAVKAELDPPRAGDPDPEPDSDSLFDAITTPPPPPPDATELDLQRPEVNELEGSGFANEASDAALPGSTEGELSDLERAVLEAEDWRAPLAGIPFELDALIAVRKRAVADAERELAAGVPRRIRLGDPDLDGFSRADCANCLHTWLSDAPRGDDACPDCGGVLARHAFLGGEVDEPGLGYQAAYNDAILTGLRAQSPRFAWHLLFEAPRSVFRRLARKSGAPEAVCDVAYQVSAGDEGATLELLEWLGGKVTEDGRSPEEQKEAALAALAEIGAEPDDGEVLGRHQAEAQLEHGLLARHGDAGPHHLCPMCLLRWPTEGEPPASCPQCGSPLVYEQAYVEGESAQAAFNARMEKQLRTQLVPGFEWSQLNDA